MAIIPQAKGSDRQAVVIIGAGIGGLTAALALGAAGFRVVVAERADHLSETGAGIQLSPNAGRILERLGVEPRIAAAAIEPEAIEIRSGHTGKVLTSIPGATFRTRYGFPYRVIHRADLQAALFAAVDSNPAIDLELGATVVQYLPQDGGLLVRIRKPGGIDVVPALAMIAADGVWSTFREKIAGSARPVPTRRTAWRAVIAADTAREILAMDRVVLWLGRDAHVVHYPIANGAAANIVAIVRETWEKQGWSAPGDRAELLPRFASWPEPARKILAAPHNWQKFAINRVSADAPWSDGRLALLGDAAHAMVPFLAQGAVMAIEDAVVLADALHGATDIPAALRAYETARKERVARVAAAAETAGNQYHYGGPMALARDLALGFRGERLILERNDWIYRWPASAANDAEPA